LGELSLSRRKTGKKWGRAGIDGKGAREGEGGRGESAAGEKKNACIRALFVHFRWS